MQMEKGDKGSTMIRMGVSGRVGECFFWYRPTRVVPDQRPLNGRCCCCFQPLSISFFPPSHSTSSPDRFLAAAPLFVRGVGGRALSRSPHRSPSIAPCSRRLRLIQQSKYRLDVFHDQVRHRWLFFDDREQAGRMRGRRRRRCCATCIPIFVVLLLRR